MSRRPRWPNPLKPAFLPVVSALLMIPLLLPAAHWLAATGLMVALISAMPDAWGQANGKVASPSRLTQLAAVVGPLLLAALLYHRNTHAWWLFDDPTILRQLLEYPLLGNFFDPDTWRSFASPNLAPWLVLSFAADHALFGLEPWGYYVHHLLIFGVLLLSGYVVLSRWLPPFPTATLLMAFTASVPVATVMQQLMTRHYLEGLLLSLWAVAAFQHGLETRRRVFSWLAALLYLLACSAKEIYVPLALWLPFLPAAAGWRQRLLHASPSILAAGLYTVWRLYMLKPENAVSGYGSLYDAAPAGSGQVWDLLSAGMGWGGGWLPALTAFLCLWGVLGWLRQRRYGELLAVGLGMALVVAPLVPVLRILSSRHLLLFSAVLSLLAGLGLVRLAERPDPWRRALASSVAVLWVALAVQSVCRSTIWEDRAYLDRYRTEGRFILEGDPHQTLLTPVGQPWYYNGLAWIREHTLGRGSAPAVCYDACLCPAPLLDRAVRAEARGLVAAEATTAGCSYADAPISVHIEYDPSAGRLSWHFGPYQEGQWSYVHLPHAEHLPLPASGQTPFRIREVLNLRIQYQSPAGWKALSEILQLDPKQLEEDGRAHIRWRRDAQTADGAGKDDWPGLDR